MSDSTQDTSATPLPAEVPLTGSARHDDILSGAHQLINECWGWLKSALPEHDLKDTVLNNFKQAWDNTVALVRAEADRALTVLREQQPAVEEAAQTVESELVTAGQEAVTGVAQEVEKAVGAEVPSSGAAESPSTAPSAPAPNASSTSVSESPTAP
jgi:hypothetical protein